VLEPTVNELPQMRLGPNEQLVFDSIQQMSGCTQDEILDATVEKLPKPDGHDKRKYHLKRALIGLISKQAAVVHGDRIYKAGDVAADMAEVIGETNEVSN
jgi:hypothetical protein